MSNDAITWAYEQSTGYGAGCKAVLIALADFADESGSCYPGQDLLAKRTEQDERSVRRQLDRLRELGLIRTEKRHDKGGHRTSDRYYLALTVEVKRTRRPQNMGQPDTVPTGQNTHRANYPLGTGARLPDTVSANPLEEPLGKNPSGSSSEIVARNPAKVPDLEPSPLIRELCKHLADRVEGNGSKRPRIGKGWFTSCRLLIEVDGRSPEQIHAAIDWCQADEFWRANILSMPKLREKYDQLRLAASRPKPQRSGDDKVRDGLALAERLREQRLHEERRERIEA